MSELPQRLNEALAGRYSIQRMLGAGGMATVWLAHDERHDRPVALKVLNEHISAAVGADRFLEEIRITARLNHPHVVPLLDSGKADGLLFSVMPLVSGESLRSLLLRDDHLSLDETLQIARQVASALDHAHRKGVVHRDVKPENILFSGGHAVVSDFGIARAMSLAGPRHLTRTGFGVGTLGYMSPEQAAGRDEIDERADVFALGAVTYEMLVGSTPGGWMTEEAIRVGRYLQAPADHRKRLDQLPGRVEQVLVKAMAISPDSRYDGAGGFVVALEEASSGTRKLTDAQVQELLRRATELEIEPEADADTEPSDQALTMGALEQVAAEAGITPTTIRRAADELGVDSRPGVAVSSRSSPPVPSPPLPPMPAKKGMSFLNADRVARGVISGGDHERLVGEIQSRLGILGHVSIVGQSLTWSPATPGDDARKIVVTLQPVDGLTQVHVEERLELAGWRIMIPAWGAAGAIIATLLTLVGLGLDIDRFAPLMLANAFVGAFLTVNGVIWSTAKRRQPELDDLAQGLKETIEERHLPEPTE
jgi:serine/threonine protein kinase